MCGGSMLTSADRTPSAQVSKGELRSFVRDLGIKAASVETDEIDALFHEWDTDGKPAAPASNPA